MSDEFIEGEDDILEPNADFDGGDGVDQGTGIEETIYDVDAAKAADETAFDAAVNAGVVDPNPEGVGEGRTDIAERLRAREEGDAPPMASAVGEHDIGRFSSLKKTSAGRVSMDGDELTAVMERLSALEGEREAQPSQISRKAPLSLEPIPPLRFYLVILFGGRFQTWAFRNMQAMNGFAQGKEGERRMFAYRTMPDPDKVMTELEEINGLGKFLNRGK